MTLWCAVPLHAMTSSVIYYSTDARKNEFIQSARLEEAMPESYDKCEPLYSV